MDCIPENLIINVIITVAKAVSHSGNKPPRYRGIGFAQLSRKALNGFTEYLQCSLQCQQTLPVRFQLWQSLVRAEILRMERMFCDLRKSRKGITLAHR